MDGMCGGTETLPNYNAAAPYRSTMVNAWGAGSDLCKLRMIFSVCIVLREEAELSGEGYG
jgi:hypothetical protein